MLQKIFCAGLQKRFSAGKTDAVQYPAPFFKVREQFALRDFIRQRSPDYERGVVAERTAKIAPPGEDGAGDFFGVIKQSELLQPAYFQKAIPRLRKETARLSVTNIRRHTTDTIYWNDYITAALNMQ